MDISQTVLACIRWFGEWPFTVAENAIIAIMMTAMTRLAVAVVAVTVAMVGRIHIVGGQEWY